jgi:hypothetical protein
MVCKYNAPFHGWEVSTYAFLITNMPTIREIIRADKTVVVVRISTSITPREWSIRLFTAEHIRNLI